MSEKNIQIPFCDDHPDDIAYTFCKYHKKLCCITCVLEKAKSSECSITEISKISGEQDTALYEGLLVRQIAINKKRLIEENEIKTEALKNTLKQQITDFHEQVMTSLNKTRDDCLSILEKHSDRIIAPNKNTKIQLESFEKVITENVEKLSAQSCSDLSEIQTKLHKVKQSLLTEFPDVEPNLEGSFQADECLKGILSGSELTLGSVYLISQSHYDQVENESDINVESKFKEVTDTEENKELVHQKQAAYLSSEEVLNSTALPDKGSQEIEKVTAVKDSSEKPQDNVSGKQKQEEFKKEESKHEQMSQNVKENKHHGGFFNLFRRRKLDFEKQDNDTETEINLPDIEDGQGKQNAAQNVTEVIYQHSSLHTQEYNQLTKMINKTVSIDQIDEHFRSACTFSKLVYLGSGYLGLLSKAQETVLLTGIDGKFHAIQTVPGISDIAASGREQVAAIKIANKILRIVKYNVSNKRFEPVGDFIVNADVPRITGFDFDVASSTFAVSLPGRLIIFKTGKVEREASYPIGNTSVIGEVVTSYDFRNDCLHLLDSQNNTLKSFSFAKNESLWKIRIDSQHKARNFFLYEDKLCITCGNAIGLFNSTDGKAVLKHNTNDLLDDCYGICVIDGVIVFSSNSSVFDTSAKLAFICM